MMIFIGLILFIAYLIGAINGGWFLDTLKEGKDFTQEKFDTMEEEEQVKYSIKMIAKALWVLFISISLLILKVVFLIGALSVDVILVPTIVLLVLFIVKIVRFSTDEKFRKKVNNRSEEERKSKTRISNAIYALYVLYILFLLIV